LTTIINNQYLNHMDPIQKTALAEVYYQNLYAGLIGVHFNPLTKKQTIEFYQDEQKQWHWQICSFNGEVTGASMEGYGNKSMCKQNLANVARDILDLLEKEPD
jgi:uncharacterized protein YegP (UPF0339 family)